MLSTGCHFIPLQSRTIVSRGLSLYIYNTLPHMHIVCLTAGEQATSKENASDLVAFNIRSLDEDEAGAGQSDLCSHEQKA